MKNRILFLLGLGIALTVNAAAQAGTVYHVVLLGGQSNMDGHWQNTKTVNGVANTPADDGAATDQLPAALQQPQTNILYNNNWATTNSYYTGSNLTALQPGKTADGNNIPTNYGYFGPEITFGQKIAADKPNNQYLIIKYAVAGTNLATQWTATTTPGTNNGYVYRAFQAAVASALNQITAAGNTYQIDGMLWLQGEADASDPTMAPAYGANLTNLINDVRSKYGANLPFIISGIGYETDATGTADRTLVQTAFSNVAATMPNVRYFNNDDLNPTNQLHFSASAQQTIGQRYASALESVPEPTSIAGMALGAVMTLRRRRR
jgi:hypothetical protein